MARPFAALAAVAGRHPTALILLGGLGSLAAPLALAAAIISSQAGGSGKPLVTCWNNTPAISVSGPDAQVRRLNSEFFGIDRSSFVGESGGAIAYPTTAHAEGQVSSPRLSLRPAVQMVVIARSIRLQGNSHIQTRIDFIPALSRVAPKI